MDENDDIWFPAKRYGWGWGPPNTWQGWAVIAVYGLCMAVNAVHFLGRGDTASFVIATVVLTAFLILICWAKGEKPEWRWGGK
jgi:hypothetical protein